MFLWGICNPTCLWRAGLRVYIHTYLDCLLLRMGSHWMDTDCLRMGSLSSGFLGMGCIRWRSFLWDSSRCSESRFQFCIRTLFSVVVVFRDVVSDPEKLVLFRLGGTCQCCMLSSDIGNETSWYGLLGIAGCPVLLEGVSMPLLAASYSLEVGKSFPLEAISVILM